MKYIIEIENEPFVRNNDTFFSRGMDKLYKAKGFKSLVFDQDGLDKLTPYTEPDRKAIEDEVWEFAKKVRLEDFIDEEGRLRGYISGFDSYSEAKATYEAWKTQKDEIRVGDEVVYHGNKYVVGYVGADEVYHIVDRNWIRVVVQGDYQIFKTGKHFDEVEELLKKMMGVEADD